MLKTRQSIEGLYRSWASCKKSGLLLYHLRGGLVIRGHVPLGKASFNASGTILRQAGSTNGVGSIIHWQAGVITNGVGSINH